MFLNVIKTGHNLIASHIIRKPIQHLNSFYQQFSHSKLSDLNKPKMTKTIAIGQMRSTNDKEHNRSQVRQIVELAAQQKACFVFLPECCDYVGTNKDEAIALSEPINGPTVQFYRDLAKSNNIWMSLGGIHEAIHNNNGEHTKKMHNSHIIINNDGELVAIYRKLHLFDVQTDDFKFRESDVINGGDNIIAPLTNTPLSGGLGLLICYDVRFPEVSTILRKNGATFLTYPSAFAFSTGKAHWEQLLRARAIENQCYVIAAAQIGFHNPKRQSYGHAMIVDPWGKILIESNNNPDIVQCLTTTIDLNKINDIRERMPCLNHRRNEVYTLTTIQMIHGNETIAKRDETREAIHESEPYFLFEKNQIQKSTIFYETSHCVAFTNITCVVPGHVLIATRRCVPRLKDLNPEEITDLFLTVCKCQRLLELYHKTTSSTVTVQDGEFAGQTVRHVHCHIMPRKEGDFEHNDQIYIELNKHDHPNGNNDRRRRTLEERTNEANEYRHLFHDFNAF